MESSPHRHDSRGFARGRDVVLAVLLFVAVFVVYHPALHGEFLLDDDVHVTRPELRSMHGLARIWTETGATQQYYPLVHTAFWLEHRAWGDRELGYHLVNVLVHTAVALLVVALMTRLGLQGGWLAAFGFALHPIAVESVAWIAEQKNTLSTVFYLGAAWAFLGYNDRGGLGRYMVASLLFACALLSKTATATLPAVLLVIAWWRRGHIGLKRDLVPLLPWFAAAAAVGLITLSVEHTLITGITANLSLSWTERLLVAGRALWFYLGKLVWPANLSFIYERWTVDARDVMHFLFPLGALAVGVWAIWLARRTRGLLAALLCFTGTLFPVLGFVNVEWFVFSYVADHFQYVASLAVIVPLAAAATTFTTALRTSGRRVALGSAVGLIGVLAVLSWQRSGAFRDNVTLYTEAAGRSPESVAAHYLRGVALADRRDRANEAIAAFEAALRLNPDAAQVREKLAAVLLTMRDRTHEAIGHLESALRLRPGSPAARHMLAAAWFDAGKAAAARGDDREALAGYERAVQFDPRLAEAHYNLGNLLLRTPGRHDDAIARFEAAVQLKPDFAEAHTNLGAALVTQPGRLADAIAHFEAALRANPDFAPARNNLARARKLQD